MPRDPFQGGPTIAFVRAVNDRYVAYGLLINTLREGTAFRFIVLDARHMRIATNVELYTGSREYLPTVGSVEPDAVLAANGAVAWVAKLPPPSPTFELRYAARGADSSTLVAASADIEPGSLAMNRQYVYWRQGNTTGAFAIDR